MKTNKKKDVGKKKVVIQIRKLDKLETTFQRNRINA
jgi:hypothetical protein